MSLKVEEAMMWLLCALGAIMMALLLFVALPIAIHRGNEADLLAARMNCINLGHARDMNTVFFFDCSGEIRLVRVVE